MPNPPRNDTPDKALVEREYRKTATIKAVQWWQMGDHPAVVLKSDPLRYADEGIPWIETLEGGHVVTPGDWIATGVNGEHWPIKPDVFAKTYEPVEAALSQPQHGGLVEAIDNLCKHLPAAADIPQDYIDGWYDCASQARDEMRAALASNSPVVGEDAPDTFWMIERNDGEGWLSSLRGATSRDPLRCLQFDSTEEALSARRSLPWSKQLQFKVDPTEHKWADKIKPAFDQILNKPTPTDTADRREAIALVREHVLDIRQKADRKRRAQYLNAPDLVARDKKIAQDYDKLADAIASLIAAPDGMVLVPCEPTETMLEAGERAWCRHNNGDPYTNEIRDICSAMIAAATGDAC